MILFVQPLNLNFVKDIGAIIILIIIIICNTDYLFYYYIEETRILGVYPP